MSNQSLLNISKGLSSIREFADDRAITTGPNIIDGIFQLTNGYLNGNCTMDFRLADGSIDRHALSLFFAYRSESGFGSLAKFCPFDAGRRNRIYYIPENAQIS